MLLDIHLSRTPDSYKIPSSYCLSSHFVETLGERRSQYRNTKLSAEIIEMLFMLDSFIIPLVICFLGVVAALVAFMIHKKRKNTSDSTIRRLQNNDRLSRPLGLLEQVLLERERVNHWGTVSSVLLLDSEEELNQDHLRKALSLLPKRFPLLRMQIKERGGEACFEEMESPDTVDFEVLDGITADNREEGFDEEINGALFNTEIGPLWRVRLLRETLANGKFRNALVFTFLHVICDALSIFELQKTLLEFLNSLHRGEEVEVNSLPLRPPVEELTSNLVKTSMLERLLFSSFFILQRVKTFFFKPEPNQYLSVCPPVANSHPLVSKRTCLLSRNLSEEETRLLIESCKENKCTVNGAITASTHLAMARILQPRQQDIKKPVCVDSTYSISLRKDCQPKVNNDALGAYVSASTLSLPVPASLVDPDDEKGFWVFARACTHEVHTQLDSGKHMNLLKFYQCIDIPTYCKMTECKYNEGRRSQIFNINNYGAQETNQSEESPYKFAGLYFGVHETTMGPTFAHNILTVDGKLYWAVEYFPHVTTKTQAEDFTDSSLNILKDACV